jgi:hypothetical protein
LHHFVASRNIFNVSKTFLNNSRQLPTHRIQILLHIAMVSMPQILESEQEQSFGLNCPPLSLASQEKHLPSSVLEIKNSIAGLVLVL